MYESVALFWTTCNAFRDVGFAAEHAELRENGWEEYARAPCKGGAGGACIMRRLKEEPQEKLEPVYEYVAVLNEDEAKGQWDALKKRGWAQVRCVRLAGRLGHIHLMRRIDPTVVTAEVESKDEPRKWTEGELRELAGQVYIGFDMEKECAGHRTWTEREIEKVARDAVLCMQELQKRNEELQGRLSERQETILAQPLRIAELQAAIDKVVNESRRLDRAETTDFAVTYNAVVAHLYPLVTKKEKANG